MAYRRWGTYWGIASLFFWFLLGCAKTPTLVPAPSAETIGVRAVERVEGVRVAATGAWTAKQEIREEITPMRVMIENEHGKPLRISYSNFSLVGPLGRRYAAIPPFDIEGSIQVPTTTSDFCCPGFYVAGHYSRFYPHLPGYRGPFYYDPFYHNRYYSYWVDIPLPTQEMLDAALPEGVLEDGSELSGYIYFEKVEEAEWYTLKVELVDASDGTRFGTITIPFDLEE